MEWISVKEKQHPDEDIQCLVVKNKYVQILQWNKHELVWDDEHGDDFYCKAEKVDYWMPLPTQPKE